MVSNIIPPSKKSTSIDLIAGKDLTGKIALITGANCGIGYETARALALVNCHVFLACRNPKSANEAKSNILKEHSEAKVGILSLDLMELSSVRECAANFIKIGLPLHLLILNAGVYNPIHRVTDDGFEATFQINHLSQFLLTHLLMEKILASAPAKIIVVASDAYKFAGNLTTEQITWDKLSPTHKHGLNSAMNAYGLSKFCNILFARELDRLYGADGVKCFSLHPGVVKTNVFRNIGKFGFLFKIFTKPVIKTPEHGAATTVYLAVAENLILHSGEYFVDCRRTETKPAAESVENSAKLWKLSEEMIKHHELESAKSR